MLVFLVLLMGVVAVSFASILIKLCDAPSLIIAAYRLAFAALFFLAASGVKRVHPLKTFSRRDFAVAVFSGLFLSIHFATWITSLKYTSVASSVVLVSTAPVFVALGSFFFLKEKLSKWLVGGIALSTVGAAVLSWQDFALKRDHLTGDLLALLGAVGGAGYFLAGRDLRARIDTLAYVTVVYSTTAVCLIAVAALFGLPFFTYTPRVYLLFFLIAFLPQVIGHTSFNWALKYVSAALVAMVTLGEPIGASVLAFFLLDEELTLVQILGGVLILSGVALAIRGETRARRTS